MASQEAWGNLRSLLNRLLFIIMDEEKEQEKEKKARDREGENKMRKYFHSGNY